MLEKRFTCLLSLFHCLMSVIQGTLWQGILRSTIADYKMLYQKNWSFINIPCDCRCSFKNRNTLIIRGFIEVICILFVKKNKGKKQEKGGENTKAGEEWQVSVEFFSLRGLGLAQQVAMGNFLPLSYKCRKLCISVPQGALRRPPAIPLLFLQALQPRMLLFWFTQ